jgi:hypothetical protein
VGGMLSYMSVNLNFGWCSASGTKVVGHYFVLIAIHDMVLVNKKYVDLLEMGSAKKYSYFSKIQMSM